MNKNLTSVGIETAGRGTHFPHMIDPGCAILACCVRSFVVSRAKVPDLPVRWRSQVEGLSGREQMGKLLNKASTARAVIPATKSIAQSGISPPLPPLRHAPSPSCSQRVEHVLTFRRKGRVAYSTSAGIPFTRLNSALPPHHNRWTLSLHYFTPLGDSITAQEPPLRPYTPLL